MSVVRALESQKAQLAAQITSLRSVSTMSRFNNNSTSTSTPTSNSKTTTSTAPPRSSSSSAETSASTSLDSPSHPLDAALLAASVTRTQSLAATQLENGYRMAGITTFFVKDPAPGGEKLVGIRIESFAKSKFLAPYYLLLTLRPIRSNKSDRSSSTTTAPVESYYALHRATIPPFLNLSSLAQRYLPPNVPTSKQQLERLVRELRRRIAAFNRRGEALEKIQFRVQKRNLGDDTTGSAEPEEREGGLGLGKMRRISWDEARENVEVEWGTLEGGRKVIATIRLAEDGSVERSIVMEYVGDGEGKGAQRMRRVERRLKVEGVKVLRRG
ncbi:hypothetical protein BDZ91DRAFT_714349 [Kalaharituber pfeilii]|nr:hypothetical protein BDZ91DRAFT_714349 [Kalaharituber pfeilii]